MPLYSDSGNYYYSGGSSQLYSPYYSTGSGISSATSSYTPYTSTYNRSYGSSSYVVPLTPPRSPTYTTVTHSFGSRYQPKLTTITETSPLGLSSARHGGLIPLTRIQSPKYTSSYVPSSSTTNSAASIPRYIPPRPIAINTADIDVSSSRYRKRSAEPSTLSDKRYTKGTEKSEEPAKETSEDASKDISKEANCDSSTTVASSNIEGRQPRRSTIRRNRAVVRLSTIRTRSNERKQVTLDLNKPPDNQFKDLPEPPEPSLSWRQKLAEDLAKCNMTAVKKSPGELLRERFLIQHDADEDRYTCDREQRLAVRPPENVNEPIKPNEAAAEDTDSNEDSLASASETEHAVQETLRRLSLVPCPTFHDICEDISSDKIDDDLNAGELRRRASIIQEQEQEILNQLQKSASGTQLLIHLERKGSHDSTADESVASLAQSGKRRSSKKKRRSKKIRHKITAIVEIDNAPSTLMPVVQELNEPLDTPVMSPVAKKTSPKPKFTANVETVDEHHEIHKIFKLPKKKSVKNIAKRKEVALPEGFMIASPKAKKALPAKTGQTEATAINKNYVSTAEIFTFDDKVMEKQAKDDKICAKDKDKTTKLEAKADINSEKLKEKDKISAQPHKKTVQTSISLEAIQDTKTIDKQNKIPNKSTSLEQMDTKVGTKAPSSGKTDTLKVENETKVELEPKIATPKPIRKAIQKSESGEDFWSKIGARESLYMDQRKKILADRQWQSQTDGTDRAFPTMLEDERSSEVEPIESTSSIENTTELKKPKSEKVMDVIKRDLKQENVDSKKRTAGTATTSTSTSTLLINLTDNTTTAKVAEASAAQSQQSLTPTLPKSPTLPSTVTKINAGQIAKSPEQQHQQQTTIAAKTTLNKMATTTTTTAAVTLAGSATKTMMQQSETKHSSDAGGAGGSDPGVTTSNLPEAQSTVQTPKATTTTVAGKEKPTTTTTMVLLKTKTAAGTAAAATAASKTTTKTKTTTTTATTSIGTANKTKTTTGGGEPVTPINADQFVTAAPAKTTLTSTSPTKSKNSSPNKTVNIATTGTTVAATTTTTTTTTATVETKQIVTPTAVTVKTTIKTKENATKNDNNNNNDGKLATAPKAANLQKTEQNNNKSQTRADRVGGSGEFIGYDGNSDGKIHDTIGGNIAGNGDGDGKGSEKKGNDSGSGYNLSKFATVSNLAQCLRDVDAELDDYIPSSAENTDDSEDDDDDDSQYNYSSADGCSFSGLSASMKKKERQRRKKDKKAKEAAAEAQNRFNPQKKIKIDTTNKCYVKEEAPRYPLVATPRPLWKREKVIYSDEDTEDDSDETSEESGGGSGTEETTDDSEECSTSAEEYEDDLQTGGVNAVGGVKKSTTTAVAAFNLGGGATTIGTTGTSNTVATTTTTQSPSIIRMSTCSNDSGFEGGTAPSSPKKMLECDVNCHKKCERLTANLCGVNQKLIVEALNYVKRGARETRDSPSTPPSSNPAYNIEHSEEHDETSYTYSQFQKSGRFTAPATVIPRFKNYSVDDFHFLAVLGKGSFGKVLLAELRDTTYYYAVKCLKKDVVLEDDDVDSTLIERKVLALGTKHPYLCHLFCTFQTESHLFFVMEYLNGGDLMFHIQESGRFSEERARFYGAEIISGLKFLHKKGIIYRDLKLDNVLLDYEGHVRIADFGMCKLQIYLDKTADSFCGTPDYMAPEIIKGEKYNQNVDWWSFGVLLYEMLIGQSPFSGCDEDELFWSICNEIPWFPVYISAEATGILRGLLEKDYTKRIGSQYSPAGDISDHIFFRPIDWNLLEKRQIEPPFKPQVKHPLDTQYFDRVFTRERVRLTPIDKEILASMDQKQFHGFTYTNPHITLD